MAERKVVPATYFLFIAPADDEVYSLMICLLSYTFKRSIATVNASTFCGPSSKAGDITVGIDFSGEIMNDPDADRISEPGLDRLLANKTTIGWKISAAVPDEFDFTYTGHGFISDLTDTFDTSNSNFSGSISVDGEYEQIIGIES
jgi:hypothetical protein